MTRLLALDVSLNATGIVYPDGRIDCLRPPKALRLSRGFNLFAAAFPKRAAKWWPDQMRGGDRLLWWSTTWAVTLQDARPDRIVIEQPFAGKIRGDSTAKLQQAYGVLLAEIARNCPTAVVTWVPPATLKKAATGKGNASKAEMIAATKAYGWLCPTVLRITDDNEADAWLLWELCRRGEFDK